MRFRLLAIGRLSPGPIKALEAFYAGRITPPAAIVEREVRARQPPPVLRAREGALILAAVPAGAPLAALDERGLSLSSRGFAERIAGWRARGLAELAFAIGGADGLDPAVLDRAEMVLSLGPMTWPHRLARVLLLEQLYRAQQILAGHPYHRE